MSRVGFRRGDVRKVERSVGPFAPTVQFAENSVADDLKNKQINGFRVICVICGVIDFEFRVELHIVLLSILVLNIPVLNIPVSNPLSERNLGFFEVTVDGLG
jgi:hypothetical protein